LFFLWEQTRVQDGVARTGGFSNTGVNCLPFVEHLLALDSALVCFNCYVIHRLPCALFLFLIGLERPCICISFRNEAVEIELLISPPIYLCCWLSHPLSFRILDHISTSCSVALSGGELD